MPAEHLQTAVQVSGADDFGKGWAYYGAEGVKPALLIWADCSVYELQRSSLCPSLNNFKGAVFVGWSNYINLHECSVMAIKTADKIRK